MSHFTWLSEITVNIDRSITVEGLFRWVRQVKQLNNQDKHSTGPSMGLIWPQGAYWLSQCPQVWLAFYYNLQYKKISLNSKLQYFLMHSMFFIWTNKTKEKINTNVYNKVASKPVRMHYIIWLSGFLIDKQPKLTAFVSGIMLITHRAARILEICINCCFYYIRGQSILEKVCDSVQHNASFIHKRMKQE